MSDERLKECPICGGEATPLYCENGNRYTSNILYLSKRGTIKCKKCELTLPRVYSRVSKAIEVWNTRKPMERIVERLEKELELSDKEIKRCIAENPLQFEKAEGYATGIYNAIEIVKGGGVDETD